MDIYTWMNSIAENKDGYNFGECWQYKKTSPVAVIPILRHTDLERSYRLLSEAEKVEIIDSGMIDKVTIKNHESAPLFVRMGEIFAGKTQERMAVRSHIVMPNSTISVDVRCIHASRQIEQDEVLHGGSFVTRSLERINYWSGIQSKAVGQKETWETVREESERVSKSASSLSTSRGGSSTTSASTSTTGGGYSAAKDDLKAHLDEFNELLKTIIAEIPYAADQVGIAIHDTGRVLGLELFDQTDSWEAIKGAILSKEGENISKVDEDNVFGFSRDSVMRNIQKLLIDEYEETIVYDCENYRITALRSKEYLGEVTELANTMIHLSIIAEE